MFLSLLWQETAKKAFPFCTLQIYDFFPWLSVCLSPHFYGNVTANVSKICNRFKNADVLKKQKKTQTYIYNEKKQLSFLYKTQYHFLAKGN